jgi:hypothetical protein
MVLEVAPTQDTFVPFEVSTIDLPVGWYRLECEMVIDADPAVIRPGAPFVSAWPRTSVRRGTVTVGTKAGHVALEVLECLSDSVRIVFAADEAPGVTLEIDGSSHPVLDVEFDPDAGRGVVVGYPALRKQERLTVNVRGESPTEVALP